jgi:3-oxoacyl-[acyl-carrier protein] reductase
MVSSLSDQTILVTGANDGIGAAIVRAFAQQRARIGLHFLDAAPSPIPGVEVGHTFAGRGGAETVAAEARANGAAVVLAPANLADPEAIRPLFDAVESALGPVDILVNNAAHFENPDTVFDVSASTFDRYFAVNTRAPALLMQEFARRRRTRGARDGRIINISTDAARAFATQIGYGASKSALEALTRSAAYELGPFGITVNAIAPGPVQTGYITTEMERELLPTIPLRRLGTPADIADVVVLFASDATRWMTGQVVQVSGGHAL